VALPGCEVQEMTFKPKWALWILTLSGAAVLAYISLAKFLWGE
jgi:hypothetical protein